jgi:hypothetical protein
MQELLRFTPALAKSAFGICVFILHFLFCLVFNALRTLDGVQAMQN